MGELRAAFTVVRDQGLPDRVSEAAKTRLLADPAGWLADRQRTRLADPVFGPPDRLPA